MIDFESDLDEDATIPWISTADVFLVLVVIAVSALAVVRHDASVVISKRVSESVADRATIVVLSSDVARIQNLLKAVETVRDAALANVVLLEAQLAELREVSKPGLEAAKRLSDLDSVVRRMTAELSEVTAIAKLSASERDVALADATRLRTELSVLRALEIKSKTIEEARGLAQAEVQRLTNERDVLRAELLRMTDERDGLRKSQMLLVAERETLTTNLNRLKPQIVPGTTEGELRKDILGIDGSLNRVVFVIDRSGSMDVDGRWDFVKKTMRIWIDLLPVGEAALVSFSTDAKRFPESGGELLSMADPVQRAKLFGELAELTPRGATNTYKALHTAFAYENIDALVLFTDGRPSASEGVHAASSDSALIEQVKKLVTDRTAQGSKTRIHVVALGDYFEPDFAGLLKFLSSSTGGAFIGR